MSWASTMRTWWSELFHSTHIDDLHSEIAYLRNECEKFRLNAALLQQQLNTVSPAGVLSARQNAPKNLNKPFNPGPSRWQTLVSARDSEIQADAIKKEQEKSKVASV